MRTIIIKIWPEGFSEYLKTDLKIDQIVRHWFKPIILMRQFTKENFNFKFGIDHEISGRDEKMRINSHYFYFYKRHRKTKRLYRITSVLEIDADDFEFNRFYGDYDYIGTEPSSFRLVLTATAVP